MSTPALLSTESTRLARRVKFAVWTVGAVVALLVGGTWVVARYLNSLATAANVETTRAIVDEHSVRLSIVEVNQTGLRDDVRELHEDVRVLYQQSANIARAVQAPVVELPARAVRP